MKIRQVSRISNHFPNLETFATFFGMTRCLIQTLFLSLLLFPAVYPLTLNEAVNQAARKNRNLLVLRQQLDETVTRKQQAESAYLPQLDLNGTYTYTSRLPEIDLGNQLPVQIPQINFGTHNIVDANVSAGYLLFDWGKRGMRVQQAEIGHRVQKLKVEAALQRVIYQTVKAYSSAALASEREALLRKYVANADSHLVDAQSKYDNGLVSEFDLLKSELQLKIFNEELAVAQAELRQARLKLSETIGLDSGEVATIDQPLAEIELRTPQEQQLDSLLLRKPEIKLTDEQVELSGLSEEIEKLRPKVTLFSSAGWKNNFMPNPDELLFNFAGGAKVSYRFFDGGYSRHKRAEEQAKQVRLQMENQRVLSEARRAIAVNREEMLKIQAKSSATAEKLTVAKKALSIAGVSYGVGLITNSEYLDTELEIKQIELEALKDRYDLLQAQLELKNSVGYWPEAE